MLAFRETKFSRSCRQSYTRLRNGRWLISRSRRLRFSRCWKRRTDYQQNFKAKSRSLTVIRKRRGSYPALRFFLSRCSTTLPIAIMHVISRKRLPKPMDFLKQPICWNKLSDLPTKTKGISEMAMSRLVPLLEFNQGF